MGFQGIQNNVPLIVIILCAIFIVLLSWFSYKKYTSISPLFKITLSSLRAAALLILLFLFLNPFYKKIQEEVLLPKFAVFYDNSESTSIVKNEYKGTESYKGAINTLLNNQPDNVELNHFAFSNNVENTQVDSLSFNKSATNLDELIKYINDLDEYNAAFIFSDGIITYGKNPIINASKSPFPLYTIAIGDTSRVKDISIQNIATNNTGFTNTTHRVKIDVNQYGFKNNQVEVKLKQNNDILQQQSISFSSNQEVYSVDFDIDLEEEGLKLFDVEIDSVAGEWTTENNKANFTVDVIDSKTHITHLVGTIHPDTKALKSILSEDENIEINSYVFLNDWVPQLNIEQEFENTDLIIIHGNIGQNIYDLISSTYSDLPILHLSLPPLDSQTEYEQVIDLIELKSNESISAYPIINTDESNHVILDLDEIDLSRTAPIFTPVQSEIKNAGSKTLLYSNIRGIDTKMPLLVVDEQTGVRKSVVNMHNWYKMYLSNNDFERQFITNLIENITDWTSTNPDNRLLKVTPSKSTYTTFEHPIINASLLNEKGSNETNANIELELSSDGENIGSYVMKNMGNGLYRVELPELPSGQYDFKAIAQKNNRDIESSTGSFVVSETNAELINTIRNDELLKGFADRTDGEFFTYDSLDNIWNSIQQHNLLETTKSVKEVYIFPVRNIIWFLLVLVLLSAEWILRKRFSLP